MIQFIEQDIKEDPVSDDEGTEEDEQHTEPIVKDFDSQCSLEEVVPYQHFPDMQ